MFKGVVISEIEDNKGIIRNRKSEEKQQTYLIVIKQQQYLTPVM
jgi:hypothetical protein